VLVVHELREDEELPRQELVREVDRRVHDSSAVRPNGVGDVANVDRVQVLVVARPLHEYLQRSKQSGFRIINQISDPIPILTIEKCGGT